MNTAVRRKAPHHMTVDEFIAWVGDGRWELVDGEPRAMAPASATHGIIQANTAYTLIRHLREAASPCRVVTEPGIVPRVRSRSNMRVPDVAVTCANVDAGQIALPEPSGPMCRSRACKRFWSSGRRRLRAICSAVTPMAHGLTNPHSSDATIRCTWNVSA